MYRKMPFIMKWTQGEILLYLREQKFPNFQAQHQWLLLDVNLSEWYVMSVELGLE